MLQSYVADTVGKKEKSNIFHSYEIYSLGSLDYPIGVKKTSCNDHFHRQFEFFFYVKNYSEENKIHFLLADYTNMYELEFEKMEDELL